MSWPSRAVIALRLERAEAALHRFWQRAHVSKAELFRDPSAGAVLDPGPEREGFNAELLRAPAEDALARLGRVAAAGAI